MYTTVYNHTTMPPKKTAMKDTLSLTYEQTATLRVAQAELHKSEEFSSENLFRADRRDAAMSAQQLQWHLVS